MSNLSRAELNPHPPLHLANVFYHFVALYHTNSITECNDQNLNLSFPFQTVFCTVSCIRNDKTNAAVPEVE